jgi:hypothetical protein
VPKKAPPALTAQAAQGTGPYALSLPSDANLPPGKYTTVRGNPAEIKADEISLDVASTFFGWDALNVDVDDGCGGKVEATVRLRISPTAGGDLSDGADAVIAGLPAGKLSLGAADVNGDGRSDLIIGSADAASGDGQVAVLLGRAAYRGSFDLADLGDATLPGFLIQGQSGDALGTAVSSAGDIACTERDGLILGAPGNDRAYLVERSATTALDLSTAPASVLTLTGPAGAATGATVAGGADANGDGIPDLAIGSPNYSTPNSFNGLATVVFGGFAGCDCATRSACRTSFDLTQLNADTDHLDGFEVQSTAAANQLGKRLAWLGQVTGSDALDDLAALAQTKLFVVPGQAATTTVDVTAASSPTTSQPPTASAAGDFDGDGLADYAYCINDAEILCTVRRGSAAPDIPYNAFPAIPEANFGGRLNQDKRDDLVFTSGEQAWVAFGRITTTKTNVGFLNSGGYVVNGDSGAKLVVTRLPDLDGDGFDEVAFGDGVNGKIYILGGGP